MNKKMRTNFKTIPVEQVLTIEGSNDRQQRRPMSIKGLDHRYPPFFIIFVSIFQLVVFVYYALRSEEPITMIGPVPFKSRLIYNPYRRYEIWRHLTYMLIHAGYWHLSFNLLIQLAIGVPLEIVHKFNPVLVIYIGGVIGGALGNSISDPFTYLAGASSGCYALITAHLSNIIINWSEIKSPCFKVIALLLFTSVDLGTAVYERHFKVIGTFAYTTSYGGHLAGALSGLLLGLVFLRNVRVHKWEQKIAHVAACIYAILVVMAIVFNLVFTDYFPYSETSELLWSQNPYSRDRQF